MTAQLVFVDHDSVGKCTLCGQEHIGGLFIFNLRSEEVDMNLLLEFTNPNEQFPEYLELKICPDCSHQMILKYLRGGR